MFKMFAAPLRKVLGVSLLVAFAWAIVLPPAAFAKERSSESSLGKLVVRGGDVDESDSDSSSSTPMAANAAVGEGGEALASFGPSSGTVVGNRALELRDEVLRLRSSVNLNANEFSLQRANGASGAVQYHSTVAAITARLQNGTTRGNPILLRQWEEAEASLNEVSSSLNRLNSLQSAVAADSSLAGYLLESVQAAFQLSGAVDEDHDQLRLLRDEVSRLVVQLDYLRNQVTDDIQRQTVYATTERSNLQTLAFAISRGELLGNSSNRPVVVPQSSPISTMPMSSELSFGAGALSTGTVAPTPMAAPIGQVGAAPVSYLKESAGASTNAMAANANAEVAASSLGRLLVLIRYNKPVVEYDQQLSQAVSTALDRMPNAEFSVVAVSPASGEPNEIARAIETAGRNAETVKRSLVQLGLSSSRITMASTQVSSAQTPEVHVYVR